MYRGSAVKEKQLAAQAGDLFCDHPKCEADDEPLSGSYKERLYISRMGEVDCYRIVVFWPSWYRPAF